MILKTVVSVGFSYNTHHEAVHTRCHLQMMWAGGTLSKGRCQGCFQKYRPISSANVFMAMDDLSYVQNLIYLISIIPQRVDLAGSESRSLRFSFSIWILYQIFGKTVTSKKNHHWELWNTVRGLVEDEFITAVEIKP